jgi:hypothetical protein
MHCDTDIRYQPKRETGCNHVHYPEACQFCSEKSTTWKQHWHRFIDHLAVGNDAESFFGERMHNPFELTRNVQANFGTVLMFAFGRDPIGVAINEKAEGERQYSNKLIYDVAEKRADRALLEMAVQLRALDELNELNDAYRQRKMPALGTVVQGDGSTTDLFFRDMTNKIIHASGFSWELADAKAPKIVCLSNDGIRWKEAHTDLVTLMTYLGSLAF